MVRNSKLTVDLNSGDGRSWSLGSVLTTRTLPLALPIFPLDGERSVCRVERFEPGDTPRLLSHGVREYVFSSVWADRPELKLDLVLHLSKDSPILRFRYRLSSQKPYRLTPGDADAPDSLTYLQAPFSETTRVREIQFSQFNALVHSFCLNEVAVEPADFENRQAVMGPLLAGFSDDASFLVAYEHGSQVPDAFLRYQLAPDRTAALVAVKGNYPPGRLLDAENPYETIWMEAGLVGGGEEELARSYRDFVLHNLSPNRASRQPLLFYNTWAYQERVKAWQKRPYLAEMNEERMLAEIEVAAQMGIEVFVVDTGWYEKTGDWRVSRSRFPDGLAPLKAKLDAHGMRLGLWFNPTVAALSSEMHRNHSDCLMTVNGKPHDPHEVWETEASQGLCLVSRYGEAFAEELIRLHQEVGVTYFKWDAIGQYGCDAPGHGHGTEENTTEERRNCYAFELGAAMARVVDRVCAACPDAIVDFDITEGGRTVGLQFLAAGKYFLINNGPYNFDYNMPIPADGNVNLFFYPGPARGWICRTPLTYDKWIPSVLFLTHYLPDDRYRVYGWNTPREVTDDSSQWVNLASLVLGQNGIWGDLLAVTTEGVGRIGQFLRLYKQVREDITESSLLRSGLPGQSPEVYEKLNDRGKGVVSLFASTAGRYTYVTRQTNVSPDRWQNEGVTVEYDTSGRARITARFERAGARVVLFGVKL